VYGDADAVVDPRNSKLLSGRIPGSQVVVFPGLGHLFFWEEPAQFTRAVASFLLAAAKKLPNGDDKGQSLPRRVPSSGDTLAAAEAVASDGTSRSRRRPGLLLS